MKYGIRLRAREMAHGIPTGPRKPGHGGKITALAMTAAALVFLHLAPAQKAAAQEFEVQATGTTYRNGKENRLAAGFAAKKPLSERIWVGFDLALSTGPKNDIVESYQFWLSYGLTEKISVTPYFWKDRFYGVDPFAAGAVVSIGKLNLIAEWECPKTSNDPTVWAEGISYSIGIERAVVTPKVIFAQYAGKAFDAVGMEIKGSYGIHSLTPFLKVKAMGDIATGKISVNAQGGIAVSP